LAFTHILIIKIEVYPSLPYLMFKIIIEYFDEKKMLTDIQALISIIYLIYLVNQLGIIKKNFFIFYIKCYS